MFGWPEGCKVQYFNFEGDPVKILPHPDRDFGDVWGVSPDTGAWEILDHLTDTEVDSNPRAHSIQVDRERFISETEEKRARYFRGAGPIGALYETIEAIIDQAEAEDRPLTPQERALVRGLRRKTYVMFERELARQGNSAADPSPES